MRADDLVQVYRAPRPVADVIIGALRAQGITCALSTDDAGGNWPHVGYVQGARVLVRAEDAPEARRIIEEAEGVH